MKLSELADTKRSSIRFSWHGNHDCFEKFGNPIIEHFTKTPLNWSHDKGDPIKLKFQLKFVKFNEVLVLGTGIPSICSQIAFLHIYFFNPASVEEYRAVLPEFAEWFSKAKTGQWIVIFDSTRAREQKSRSQVLEKIKSDVRDHQNKIFELNGLLDTKAFGTLTNAISKNFTISLDNYNSALKSITTTLSAECDITALTNNQFKLCFFYWSLEMTEHALTEIDNLSTTVNKIFAETASSLDEKVCSALNSLKSINGQNECPLLEKQLKRNSVEKGESLISLRAFILAHQFLAGSFSYEIRKDTSSNDLTNNRFATDMFNNTYNLLVWLKQNIFSNSNYDQSYQNCLQIVWTYEVFEFSKYYGNYLELELTLESASKLCLLNAESWLFLHNQKTSSLDWLLNWIKSSEGLNAETLKQIDDIQKGNCIEHCKQSLKLAVQTLKISKWHRNFVILRLQLAKLMVESGVKEDLLNAINEIMPLLPKANLPISFIYNQLKQCVGDPVYILKSSPNLLAKFNSYLCNFILSSTEQSTLSNNKSPFKLYNFDAGLNGENQFPFHIHSIHPTFITVQMHKSFRLAVNLYSNYEIPLTACTIKAVFKPLNPKTIYFNAPSFECIMQETTHQSRFQCVEEGEDKKRIASKISQPKLYAEELTDLICKFVSEQESLIVGQNQLEFEAIPERSVNLVLSHLSITHSSGLTCILAIEHEKLKSQLVGCFCFVSTKTVNVKLNEDDAQKTLYAGIAQELRICLHSGSIPISNNSLLKARFLESDCGAEFLASIGESEKWNTEFECKLPAIEAMSEHSINICFCTNINQMNYSALSSFSFTKTLEIEWQDKRWTFQLQFTSILSIKTMTSILEDRTLFETDIQNCYGNDHLLIVPLEAQMSSVDEESGSLMPADLLNDCLEPIYADSTYRLIWKLSFMKSTAPTNHNLRIRYKIQPNEENIDTKSQNKMQQIICDREYLFEDTISFSIPRVEYEICSRILSEKPQNVICRAETTCDFVISLRMLAKNKAETVIVKLEADPEHWTLIDKFKVVQIKENGLGQTTFSLVPRSGFLVYPSVFIHRFNSNENASERDLVNLNESKLFGERITTFNRSEAKQIHVLGNPTDDTDSVSTTSGIKSLRVQAKERLQRLFD